MKNKRPFIIFAAIVGLLLIPLIVMQFSPLISVEFADEVNWTLGDFAVMGVLLLGVGTAIEVTLRKVKSLKYRLIVSLIILIIFLLIWAELAVGIFGTPFAGS